MKTLLIVLGILAISACGQKPQAQWPYAYSSAPISDKAHVFLIAGERDNANYIQAVIDLKQYWLSQGVPESEILCYYVEPTLEAWEADREQYDALGPQLNTCYLASMEKISNHLLQVSKNVENLFFYATSHGRSSLRHQLNVTSDLLKMTDYMWLLQSNYELFAYPAVSLPVLDGAPSSMKAVVKKAQNSKSLGTLVLSPYTLASQLELFRVEASKTVVISSCYSGGFIEESYDSESVSFSHDTLSPLAKLPYISIMTASRFDRSSFGCIPGVHKTIFDDVFYETLLQENSFQEINWKDFYSKLRVEISLREKFMLEEDELPSEPQFFESLDLVHTPQVTTTF